MVTVEVELDEETVRALSREAAQFEFRGSESYVRWVLDHRALVLSKSDAFTKRLTTLESRLNELEAADTGTGDGDATVEAAETSDGEAVRDVIDQWLVVAGQAGDDEVARAVSRVERRNERVGEGRDRQGRQPRRGAVEGTLDDELDC